MKLIYTKNYNKSIKSLKNRVSEKKLLDEILFYIKNQPDFDTMVNDPLSNLYRLERLKYELSDYYSFRLSKTIRLIIRPKDNNIEVYLVYISKEHYKDFNEDKVILDEE